MRSRSRPSASSRASAPDAERHVFRLILSLTSAIDAKRRSLVPLAEKYSVRRARAGDAPDAGVHG